MRKTSVEEAGLTGRHGRWDCEGKRRHGAPGGGGGRCEGPGARGTGSLSTRTASRRRFERQPARGTSGFPAAVRSSSCKHWRTFRDFCLQRCARPYLPSFFTLWLSRKDPPVSLPHLPEAHQETQVVKPVPGPERGSRGRSRLAKASAGKQPGHRGTGTPRVRWQDAPLR